MGNLLKVISHTRGAWACLKDRGLLVSNFPEVRVTWYVSWSKVHFLIWWTAHTDKMNQILCRDWILAWSRRTGLILTKHEVKKAGY